MLNGIINFIYSGRIYFRMGINEIQGQYREKRISLLRNQILRYKDQQALWNQGKDWQYNYFQRRIEEAELEIKERSSLEKKTDAS
jgi:hypothetical protein